MRRSFSILEWGEYSKRGEEIKVPAALGGFVSVGEVYVPLAHFLRGYKGKTPFFIGITGGVSAGKTSAGRILQGLLGELGFSVELVSTDGFLYPNQKLQALGLMERKGFPESYDLAAMHSFCLAIREKRPVRLPIYDHALYDPTAEPRDIGTAEIFILDGLHLPLEQFFGSVLDFSLYLDADEKVLWQWYLQRFLSLSAKGRNEPRSYYHR
ncbi:MAG: type I pantothenate kinase, partial [Parvibaculales bacterium]